MSSIQILSKKYLKDFKAEKEAYALKIKSISDIINITCKRISQEQTKTHKLQEMLKKLQSSFTNYNHCIDACRRAIALYQLIEKDLSNMSIIYNEETNTISKVIKNEGKDDETIWFVRNDGSIYRIIIKCLPYDSETYAYNRDNSPQYVLKQKRAIWDTDACIVTMETPSLINGESYFSHTTGKVVFNKLYCFRCFVKEEITGYGSDLKTWSGEFVETWFIDEEMTQICETPKKFPSTE